MSKEVWCLFFRSLRTR